MKKRFLQTKRIRVIGINGQFGNETNEIQRKVKTRKLEKGNYGEGEQEKEKENRRRKKQKERN